MNLPPCTCDIAQALADEFSGTPREPCARHEPGHPRLIERARRVRAALAGVQNRTPDDEVEPPADPLERALTLLTGGTPIRNADSSSSLLDLFGDDLPPDAA